MGDAEFVIHTPSYEAPELRVARNRCKVSVHLLPPLANARDQLHTFDLIVMPSRYEGLPLLAMEALAAGTPVLATKVAGLQEALPPDWPLIVPCEAPAALADQIRAFVAGRDDIAELSARGRKWVEQFSAGRSHQLYLEAYSQYLGKAPPTSPVRTKIA